MSIFWRIMIMGLALGPLLSGAAMAAEVHVYKSPECSCCTSWARHMRDAGFSVIEQTTGDLERLKRAHQVPDRLFSCHTAIVDGYVIEGHVPAEDVRRLLRERPAIVGLSAPGMPRHAPGMQSAGLPLRGFDVIAFGRDAHGRVFRHYPEAD